MSGKIKNLRAVERQSLCSGGLLGNYITVKHQSMNFVPDKEGTSGEVVGTWFR
jgi:hypothetical protein